MQCKCFFVTESLLHKDSCIEMEQHVYQIYFKTLIFSCSIAPFLPLQAKMDGDVKTQKRQQWQQCIRIGDSRFDLQHLVGQFSRGQRWQWVPDFDAPEYFW